MCVCLFCSCDCVDVSVCLHLIVCAGFPCLSVGFLVLFICNPFSRARLPMLSLRRLWWTVVRACVRSFSPSCIIPHTSSHYLRWTVTQTRCSSQQSGLSNAKVCNALWSFFEHRQKETERKRYTSPHNHGRTGAKKQTSSIRTSDNAFDSESAVAMRLKRRAFKLLRMEPYDEDLADGLQLLR